MDSDQVLALVVVPALIFVARVVDVALGTLRILLLARGVRLAGLIGFFEALIWLLAIGQIVANLTNPACYVAYAGGFAAGTLAGMALEARLALGMQVVRAITRTDAKGMIDDLRGRGFGVTIVDAHGQQGLVNITYTVTSRRHVPAVVEVVRAHHPQAFVTIEDVRSVATGGVFPKAGALRK